MALALRVGSRQNNPASADVELMKKRKFFLGTVRPGLEIKQSWQGSSKSTYRCPHV